MKSLLIYILFISSLFAHPHFFIDASMKIDKEKLEYSWTFDKINSKLLTFDFDTNRNKVFEEDEQKRFIEKHFETLKNDAYNLVIDVPDTNFINITPQNIKVVLENRRVVLKFLVDAPIKKETTLCVIDPTLYMAFRLNNVDSNLKLDIQKSEHDYCIGVL